MYLTHAFIPMFPNIRFCRVCDHHVSNTVHLEPAAIQHEEILAGLVGEVAHSRIRSANGEQVQWTYNADGTMGEVFREVQ